MKRHKHTNQKIAELESEIKNLNESLDSSSIMIEIMNQHFDKVFKEKNDYRRLIKYHSLLLIIMGLIAQSEGKTDIDMMVKRHIQEYYRALAEDLVDVEEEDNEDEDEYDDSEEFDF